MSSRTAFPTLGLAPTLLAMSLLTACGSSSSSAVAAGGSAGSPTSNGGDNGDGGSSPIGGGGASPIGNGESCDHVLVRFPNLLPDVQGLAVSGGTVYVTVGDVGVRTVSEASAGALLEVGHVPSGSEFVLGDSALGADADALYLDVVQGSARALMRLPLGGGDATLLTPFRNFNGFNSPPFLTDAKYAYLELVDSVTSLSRVPLAGGAAEKIREDAFYGRGYTAIGADDTNLYIAAENHGAGEYSLSTIAKVPDDTRSPVATALYTLGACTGAPASLTVDQGTVYLGCEDLVTRQRQIYALAPAAADSKNSAKLVQKGAKLVFEHFTIAKGNLYFVDQDHLNKVPLAGGAARVVMNSHGVAYIAADDENVYLAGDCGVQKTAL